jgi:epoxyqueuosine reductase QueG
MEKLKELLIENGATIVKFANLEGLYNQDIIPANPSSKEEQQYCKIPKYPYGVSIAVKLPTEIVKGIADGPTMDYFNTYHEINRKLNALATLCEEYLVGKGFEAYAQTSEGVWEYGFFTTVMPHKTVAVSAGVGWIGKSALLVTKEFGSAIRLTSVLTNAPLSCEEPIKQSPCSNCTICQKACPGNAITGNVWSKNEGRDYIFDAAKCRKKARELADEMLHKEITLCGKCIEVCPFARKYLSSN